MLHHTSGIFILVSCALLCAANDTSEDFDDPHLILIKLRVERSDYSVGGPLAKCNPKTDKNCTTKTTTSASSSTASTTQSPKKSGTTASAPAAKSSCPLSVYPSSVLTDILWGAAKAPDYELKLTNSCRLISDCAELCDSVSCNYFMRSNINGLTKFYAINSNKLNRPKFSKTQTFDSYVTRKEECDSMGESPAAAQPAVKSSRVSASASGDDSSKPSSSVDQRKPPIGIGKGPPEPGQGHQGPRGDSGPTRDDLKEHAKQAFRAFMQKFNKTYNESDEEKYFEQFRYGLQRIKDLNSLQNSSHGLVHFGQTKFTDSPFAEFVKKFTGAVKESHPAPKFNLNLAPSSSNPNVKVPLAFDWRQEGVVPPVRYQKECGACYAFSTTDLAAMQWAIDRDEQKSYTLAPQYVLDCIHDQAAFGCDGGRPYLVLDANSNCTDDQGNCVWPRESCYPYQNAAGKSCKETKDALACARSDQPNVRLRRAYYLDLSAKGDNGRERTDVGREEKERVSTLLHGGPMVALVTVTEQWQYYTGGVMSASQCEGGGDPNHAVLIVGYNFTDPKSPHYIVRNTWDTDWGEQGYFRMEAGTNACSIAQFLSFGCTTNCGDADRKNAQNLVDRSMKRLAGLKKEKSGSEQVQTTTMMSGGSATASAAASVQSNSLQAGIARRKNGEGAGRKAGGR